MKKKVQKKLQLNVETLRNMELGTVSGGLPAESRAFTNCAYCWSSPADCPTSIYTIDNNC